MNSKNLINFEEEWNNIPYLNWIIEIGDFKLYKNDNEKIIDNAVVWYSIYWINSLKNLNLTDKRIIIVIPALTWNSKLFDSKASQWNGWANTYWKPWNILDPNKNIIIWLDYFWWPYDSTWPDKHNLNFYPVPPEKQVEAWKKALTKLNIKEIYALFWWSNWWWHIHTWLFDNKFLPKKLIPVAWPISPTNEAKEFFSIQVDLLKKREDVSDRLEENLKHLIWESKLYDELIKETVNEIKVLLKSWNNEFAIKIVRQIWFLKFLNPSFFNKFYNDKYWNKIKTFDKAKENMLNYFNKEWINFEKRFSLSSLTLLSQAIVDSERISPEEYVKKIKDDIDLIIISIEDDKLFETWPMQEYFSKVKEIRQNRWDTWSTVIKIINSTEETKQAWHDSFLWNNSMQEISNNINKNM